MRQRRLAHASVDLLEALGSLRIRTVLIFRHKARRLRQARLAYPNLAVRMQAAAARWPAPPCGVRDAAGVYPRCHNSDECPRSP